MTSLKVIIHSKNENKYFLPVILDGATLEYARKGTPGRFVFSVLKDEVISYHEGDVVQVLLDDDLIFYGYVFTKSRNKNGVITTTSYDMLRYLKNKAIYTFAGGIKASEAIKQIADDFKLKLGEIADTKFTIPKYRGSNECLIDTIQTLLGDTTMNTGEIYVLYDKCGALTLKSVEDMEVPILVDSETAENFSYESTIDKGTFNKVKLYYDNKDTGKREVWIEQDSANIARWGTLQLTENINPEKMASPAATAANKLKYFNKVRRRLDIRGALGDIRVRGGSMLYVKLSLGDVDFQKRVVVEKVKHTFSDNHHSMNLEVLGDVITG